MHSFDCTRHSQKRWDYYTGNAIKAGVLDSCYVTSGA
jgi:hypothetical protein